MEKIEEVVALGKLAQITKLAGFEYTKHFDYSVGGDIIALRSLNIKRGRLDLTEIHTIPRSVSNELPRSKLRKGDIVLGYIGSQLGNLAMIDEDDRFHLAPNVALIRPNSNVSSEYVFQFMQGPAYQNTLWSLASSTGQPALSMANIRLSKIWLPSLHEQEKIAKILSTWDKAIETADKILTNTEAKKRALMQQILTGKRRFKGFEDEWSPVTIGDVCDPKQWDTISARDSVEGGVPVFGANGHIGWTDVYNHEDPTIAVGCRGVCGSVHLTPPRSYITGNSMALDHLDLQRVTLEFLFHYLTYFGFRSIISGSAQPQITGKAIKAYKLRIPSLAEQKLIGDTLDAADLAIMQERKRIEVLELEKRSLVQQLLTGKIRVSV